MRTANSSHIHGEPPRRASIGKTPARWIGVFSCCFVELLQQSLPFRGVDLRPFIEPRVVDGDRGGTAQQSREVKLFGGECPRLLASDREYANNGVGYHQRNSDPRAGTRKRLV